VIRIFLLCIITKQAIKCTTWCQAYKHILYNPCRL